MLSCRREPIAYGWVRELAFLDGSKPPPLWQALAAREGYEGAGLQRLAREVIGAHLPKDTHNP